MARSAHNVNYVAELLSIRDNYVGATPKQRLRVIRQRLADQHFGPNRLVTAVSAVEAFARSLAMHTRAKSKSELRALYPRYKDRDPKSLVQEYLVSKGIHDASTFFGKDTWDLFRHAVNYRNLLAHECTYLGLDKFPSLIEACSEVLNALARSAKVHERGA